MFNVFGEDKKDKKNTPGKEEVTSIVFKDAVMDLVGKDDIAINLVHHIYNLLGHEKVKAMELDMATLLYEKFNKSATTGEAFAVIVMALMHCASALDATMEDFRDWRGGDVD